MQTIELSGKQINTIRALRVAGWRVHRIANFFGLEPWKVQKLTTHLSPRKLRRDTTFMTYRGDNECRPVDLMFR